ncbi:MAG TPA: sulfite exporter TauE/SafE family protein [Spirochaetes bacterium]|nr:sulfite exporter TauE/SafE family protein [Spirochaetota bacterium]
MTLQYWYLFPVSICVATLAMASGVGGATFFSPIFILALKLPAEVAIGTALVTEVFGFASGLYAYAHKKIIDYRLGMMLIIVTVPAALAGTLIAGYIDELILKIILGMGLFAVATAFLRNPGHKEVIRMDDSIKQDYPEKKAKTCINTSEGEKICYTVCDRTEGRIIAGVGGLFVGMISTGLGELNGYFLLRRCRVPSKISIATSVFVVAVTALAASAGHIFRFTRTGNEVITTVLSIVIFTVPGVVIGGQLGSRVASYIPQKIMERVLGVLFIFIATLTLAESVL